MFICTINKKSYKAREKKKYEIHQQKLNEQVLKYKKRWLIKFEAILKSKRLMRKLI